MHLQTIIRTPVTLGVVFLGLVALASLFGAGAAFGAAPSSAYHSGVQAAQSPAGQGCLPWSLVFPPNPRTHHYLNGVDAIAPDDIWAVGQYYDENNFTPDTTLAMHWDGAAWTIFPTPPVGGYLLGVDAVGPNDVWAVGHCPDCAMTSLILHWDGVQWTRIDSPSPPGHVTLHDVVTLAPNNVWAVGANDGFHSTVTMNWDGNAWSIVPSPNGGNFSDDNVLTSIDAVSPTDMWAVGYIYPKGGTPTTISMHWNGSQWSMIATPNPGNYARRLEGVTAVASNDVWAVGNYSANLGKTYTPLFLHWNGTQWQHVTSPEIGDYNSLDDVYAISSDDIWAVGTTAGCNFCAFQTLTMHWNGTAWSQEYSPNGFRDFSRLEGVTATSSGDVWAVGYTDDLSFPYRSDALTMHRVCLVATPTGTPPTATTTRTPVSTYTPTPTRTVAATPTCNPNGMRVLIVYADYESPPLTLRNGILSHPGVQTVDYVRADTTTPTLQQMMQYDVVVAFANLTSWADPTTLGNRLADYQDAHGIVVAFHMSWSGPPRGISGRWQSENYSPYEPYAGSIYNTGTLGAHNSAHPLMQGVANLSAFYRGNADLKPGAEQVAAWIDGPPLIAVKGRAVGVTAYVGDEDGGWSGDYARIIVNAGQWLRANGCGTGTPVTTSTPAPPTSTLSVTAVSTGSPQVTNTALPPTGTSVSGTQTVGTAVATSTATIVASTTSTPGACTVRFTDVAAGSTFYSNIMCLACRGIVSGYSDGTFRPNNEVTRGQLAKIVSNAAGFSEPVSGQTFADVPPSNTFYEWIERLVGRGYMSGYVCGGPGEPCINNIPYFRPFANATRGQTSKIVSNAAGFTETPSGQTFEDVPTTHTFYQEIQRLASRNIMGGYACGGPGEPCVSGRPYFRPGNNVTRGQSSKIVANTFFPDCSP